jgi:predicted dehydrogenase
VKALLERSAIGKPRFMRFTSRRNLTWPVSNGHAPLFTKQPYTTEMEQLILFEWGIHLVDVSRYLMGEIQHVYARMAKTSPYFKGEDRALLVLDLSGVTCVIDISWATVGDEAAEQRSQTQLGLHHRGDEGLSSCCLGPISLPPFKSPRIL